MTFCLSFFKQTFRLCYCLALLSQPDFLQHVTASNANGSDRSTLLAIKRNINDNELLASWNSSTHHCSWEGVRCKRVDGRVAGLDLGRKNLPGTLSPYIGNLTSLIFLYLDGNNLYGTIPEEVGYLVHLKYLVLSNNFFSGEIPKNLTSCSELMLVNLINNNFSGEIFSKISLLSKLSTLDLTENGFSGRIPSSLANLSFLTRISLKANHLEGTIPYDLCLLPKLSEFLVSENNLTGQIPFCFYNNSQLEFFGVAANQLEGNLPSHFGLSLPNLRHIYLGSNKFAGVIPISFINASSLEYIDFHENFFTGSLPRDLGSLQNLTDINFDKNQLGIGTEGGEDLEFLASLVNSSNLRTIDFKQNFLKGPLPESISNLSIKLTHLNGMGNQIFGNIPEGIQNLINIDRILLNENFLTGNIPVSIGNLPKLVKVNLQGNLLSGHIPTSLGNLTQLMDLNLGGNKLSGTIPPSLENCHNLQVLNLSHNHLVGTIPRQVIGSSFLIYELSLQHNFLTGSFPLESGTLTNVVSLDVSQNKLSGPVPNSLGKCLSMVDLYLHSNFFEDQIPLSFKALKGLQNLDLSHNKLSGEIPSFLELFPLLKLNLSFNQLQGPVPEKGIFENATAISVVGNKNLCGGVTQLQLPPCGGGRKNSSFSQRVLILVLFGSLCFLGLSCLFILYCRKKLCRRNPHSTPFLSAPPDLSATQFNRLYKVSYADLLKATNGFSDENCVGSGSYGSVYKGNLPVMKKCVAVKVLHLDFQGVSRSFFTECNALKNLRHRNLLSLITACSSTDYQGKDFKALVFDFMPNGSLEDWLHSRVHEANSAPRSLSFIQRLNIAIDVASALEYLHHHFGTPVVHCDLKPSNILLNEDMVAHVADFGIAKIISSTSYVARGSELSSVAIKGSVGYVPPEYAMAVNVSTQGDVYSYGILLLEMFTGKKPTDDVLVDGLCLHNYVEMALDSHAIMQIADPTLLLEDVKKTDNLNVDEHKSRLQVSLVSILKLGVSCSFVSAAKRSTMTEVIPALHRVMDYHHREEAISNIFANAT